MGHAFSGGPGLPPPFPPSGGMHDRRHSRRPPPSYW
jgi:hypothetical protein